jgi:biopolymer transport protein ExbB/TolQ
MIKQRITGRFILVLTSIFLYSLTLSSSALASGFDDSNYEVMQQLEKNNRIQKEMLELQQQQLREQQAENARREIEELTRPRY